jgi:hypothetical protein
VKHDFFDRLTTLWQLITVAVQQNCNTRTEIHKKTERTEAILKDNGRALAVAVDHTPTRTT